MIFLISKLFFSSALAVTLIQETQDIVCKNSETSVLVDKRDRFIEISDLTTSSLEKYFLEEFLDSGLLIKSTNLDFYGHFQLTPKNEAVLILGYKKNFTESECKDTGSSKTCKVKNRSLFWSPTKISYDLKFKNHSLLNLDLTHYGVYPNDGTYFLAISKEVGISLIDYGSKVDLVYGQLFKLKCQYKD